MVCSYVPDDKPEQKCERNEDIFVQKNALKLLVAIKMAHLCCVSGKSRFPAK